MNEKTESRTPEERPRPGDDVSLEMTPKFNDAFMNALRIFDRFIVYEIDKPEEARLNLWPFYTHIRKQEVAAAIQERYLPSGKLLLQPPPGYMEDHEGSEGWLEDQKLIKEGIDDSISILKKRTDGKFTSPGQGQLNQLENDTLLDLAYLETRLFYRMTAEDLLRGHIKICQGFAIGANQPEGSRQRTWVALRKFVAMFIDILADDTIEDPIMAIVKQSEEEDRGHDKFLRRWREQELI